MALSTVTKSLNDGSLALEDGGTPTTLTVPVSVGDWSIDNLKAASAITSEQNEVTAYETRGKFDTVRHSTRIYPSGSFTVHFRQWTSATAGEVIDFIRKQNGYSGNVSTLGSSADVYAIKITLTVEGTTHGDDADSAIVMDDCHCSVAVSEGDPTTATISYVCYGAISTSGTS